MATWKPLPVSAPIRPAPSVPARLAEPAAADDCGEGALLTAARLVRDAAHAVHLLPDKTGERLLVLAARLERRAEKAAERRCRRKVQEEP